MELSQGPSFSQFYFHTIHPWFVCSYSSIFPIVPCHYGYLSVFLLTDIWFSVLSYEDLCCCEEFCDELMYAFLWRTYLGKERRQHRVFIHSALGNNTMGFFKNICTHFYFYQKGMKSLIVSHLHQHLDLSVKKIYLLPLMGSHLYLAVILIYLFLMTNGEKLILYLLVT